MMQQVWKILVCWKELLEKAKEQVHDEGFTYKKGKNRCVYITAFKYPTKEKLVCVCCILCVCLCADLKGDRTAMCV